MFRSRDLPERFRTLVLLGVFGVLCTGCQQSPKQNCQPSTVAYPAVIPDAPVISVVAAAVESGLEADCDYFVGELRAALTSLGGVQVIAEERIPSCLKACSTGDFGINHSLPPSESGIEFRENEAASCIATVRVVVSISRFHRYRPMQLETHIAMTDLTTGELLSTVSSVWHGNPDHDPIADASCTLRKELKRPRHRSAIEWQTLSRHSPRAFLTQTAQKTAPAIRSACLADAGFIEPLPVSLPQTTP